MNQFLKIAVPGVQQLIPYLPGKPVDELERELGISNSIKLASNENPLGPSKRALAAALAALPAINFYPDGSGYKLSAALAKNHGVDESCITLGNGSNDVLELISRVFLAPECSAVFSEYAFAVYSLITQAVGAEARVAKALSADHPVMPYGHDLDSFSKQINASTRVIFIANPNNPTGTWLAKDQLEDFIVSISSDIVVVLDEAYYEYMPDELKPDTDSWLKKYSNLIVTRTFSKIYGLAGLRIGYAISHPDIADLLNRVRQPFNVNMIAQHAALEALNDIEHINQSVSLNNAGLQQLISGLKLLELNCIPSIGNFLTVDMGREANTIYNKLLAEGIIVRPLSNYSLPDHLRITVGTEEQNKRFLNALEKCIDD